MSVHRELISVFKSDQLLKLFLREDDTSEDKTPHGHITSLVNNLLSKTVPAD